jgi:hypothetical protein
MGYFKTIYTIDESPLWSNRKVPFYLNVYITLADGSRGRDCMVV